MKLTDLLPLEKWMELEQEISRRSGLGANVFGTDGVRITDFHHWPNRLCPAIKATDKGQAFICAVAHMNLATEAVNTGKPVIEECDAGLMKMVVPIIVNGEYLGAVGACGLLRDDNEPDAFLVNKITEIDEEKVEELAQGIANISSDKVKELEEYIVGEIQRIVANKV
jgi:ligand-binding sensor protein